MNDAVWRWVVIGCVGLGSLACTGAMSAGEAEPGAADPVEVRAATAPTPTPVAVAVDTAAAPTEQPDERGTGQGTADPPAPKPAGPKPAPSAAPAPAPGEPGGTSDAPPAGGPRPVAPKPAGIVQKSDTSWTVTQGLVDTWHEDPYRLGNVRESGEGWELMGIRQRNAYHLGMRNSDIVLEINGHKLNTKAQLLTTYLACKNDKKFDVLFLRGGVHKVYHYEIVN